MCISGCCNPACLLHLTLQTDGFCIPVIGTFAPFLCECRLMQQASPDQAPELFQNLPLLVGALSLVSAWKRGPVVVDGSCKHRSLPRYIGGGRRLQVQGRTRYNVLGAPSRMRADRTSDMVSQVMVGNPRNPRNEVPDVSQVILSQKAHLPTLSNAVKPDPLQPASTQCCCRMRSQIRPAYPKPERNQLQGGEWGGGGLNYKLA